MIYRSNLTCPDLHPAFASRVTCGPKHNSLGHDVLSDPTRQPDCGFLTHDEAAILHNVAKEFPGHWLDIGGAAGWSAAHLFAAGCFVTALDPIYRDERLLARTVENLKDTLVTLHPLTSEEYFSNYPDQLFDGVLVDGDHGFPWPLKDAQNAAAHLQDRGAIVFHDALGGSIQEAVLWLSNNGFDAKVYWTPHMMVACWRGEANLPEHLCDGSVARKLRDRLSGFLDACGGL